MGTGNGSGVGSYCTFNGNVKFNPDGTARDGFFSFRAAASQQNKVHDLNSQGATSDAIDGWFNQYEDITSFAVDGRAQMRKAYFAASREGKTLGDVDLMIGDEQSYLNYIEDLDDQVRVTKVEGDKAPGQVRQGVKFLNADFYLDDAIDIAAATFASGGTGAAGTATTDAALAATADGVIYGFKTPCWYSFTLGHDASKETKGDFAVRGPFRIPDQDLYRYEIVLMMGLHTNQRRANFAITGAATP